MSNIEEQMQVEFVRWFRKNYPKFSKRVTIPSFGENIGPRRMRRLKQMGLTPGWPDLLFAIPRVKSLDDYSCGLLIEMKVPGSFPTPRQKELHEELQAACFDVEVCWSVEEAKKVVKDYMDLALK